MQNAFLLISIIILLTSCTINVGSKIKKTLFRIASLRNTRQEPQGEPVVASLVRSDHLRVSAIMR